MNPLWDSGIHQNVLYGGGELRSPCQDEWGISRARIEQVPCFGSARDPPTPKLRGINCYFVPMLAGLDEAKGPCSEAGLAVL